LTQSITYKKLLVVVLTALYAFISTPAQIWHSHTHTADITEIASEDGNSQGNAFLSEDNMDGVCGICAHHYSVYTENTPAIIAAIAVPDGLPAGEFICSIPNTPIAGSCNKGPPDLC
jgi:hypothetical protein